MRALRRLGIVVGIGLALAWAAPALWVAYVLPGLAARAGGSLELERVRPAFPLGVSVGRVRIVRDGRTLELGNVAARVLPDGARVDVHVGGGSLLLRTDGWTLESGFVRAASLPLEALEGFVSTGLSLRGVADGVYRFGPRAELEANVRDGAVLLRAPAGVELPFAQLTLAASREPDGRWKIPFADVRGPPLSATAHGEIGASGELALEAEVSALAEPALSGFALLKLPTEPLPYTAKIGGTLAQPRFVPPPKPDW